MTLRLYTLRNYFFTCVDTFAQCEEIFINYIRKNIMSYQFKIRSLFLLILIVSNLLQATVNAAVTLSSEEEKLYQLLSEYRAQYGLPAIPLSVSLTEVAQTHAHDSAIYPPSGQCNLHSWSNSGFWSSCCYTPDHAQAECMWDKPRELTSYLGNGYEIAYGGDNYTANARDTLNGWKSSSDHNAVITNQNIWQNNQWNAVGIGIYQGYAFMWFGEETDPAGTLPVPINVDPTLPVISDDYLWFPVPGLLNHELQLSARMFNALDNDTPVGDLELRWLEMKRARTEGGDSVIFGYFYAADTDVSWGTDSNPEIMVKIWFSHFGELNVNFFHVGLFDINVFSKLDGYEPLSIVGHQYMNQHRVSIERPEWRYSRHDYRY